MAIDPELPHFLGGPGNANMDEIELSGEVDAALIAETLATRQEPPAGLNIRDEVAIWNENLVVPVRIYRRDNLPEATGALLFIRGGAFVFGNLESEHDRCLHYAQHSDVVVVSVEYRLAPEFPYPAALDDAWTSLHWLLEHAPELGVDPKRICIGGASAGGLLAAGLVLRYRDQTGPRIAAQMLLYPVLDDRVATLSIEAFEIYDPWNGSRSRKMWPLYLGATVATPCPTRRQQAKVTSVDCPPRI
jgi:acetyl esterase/lipase